MNQFEEYLERQIRIQECKERHERKLRRAARRERALQRARRASIIVRIVAILVLALIIACIGFSCCDASEVTPDEKTAQGAAESAPEAIPPLVVEEPVIYYDVPLDHDTQDLLRQACEESGVEMELALAVIHRETNFRNIVGDGGDSTGYMQVQKKWHWDRMERLGVDDLSDPLGNFRVGCDFLAELLGRYSVEHALTAYNSGRPGESKYASAVIEIMEGIEHENRV